MGDDRYPRNDQRFDRGDPRQARDYGYGRSESQSGAGSYAASGGRERQRSGGGEYHGSYASDGRRFEDVGRYRDADDDDRRGGYGGERGREQSRDQGRDAQGRDQGRDQGRGEERGFFERAGDEVRSWFGDDEAEHRREHDARLDEQRYGDRFSNDHDSHYSEWRRGQMDALDRDYHEYRQENRSRFESEFGAWRTTRQGQRDALIRVTEHQEVVGSDGEHVGTVDKVRDDRIILTKNDADAGGRHHSIPSRWVQSVDTRVTLTKTAQEAKDHWRDEERQDAFGMGRRDR